MNFSNFLYEDGEGGKASKNDYIEAQTKIPKQDLKKND